MQLLSSTLQQACSYTLRMPLRLMHAMPSALVSQAFTTICFCSEAFAAWLPAGGVPLSYAIAVGYVIVDTVDKGRKAYSKAETDLVDLDPAVDVPRYFPRQRPPSTLQNT